MIYKRFLFFLTVLSFGLTQAQEKDFFTLVLDAGHGGSDGGARGVGGIKEKEIALDVTLMLGEEIEKNFKDVKVVYTRKTDVFVPLHERAKIANKNNADLFISIHCNASNGKAMGTETFVLGLHRKEDHLEIAKRENSVILLEEDFEAKYEGFAPSDPSSYIGLQLYVSEHERQSLRLAQLIENTFVSDSRKSRGVKQAGFLVIRETAMPSVLVEIGFITNQDEASFLAKDWGRKKTKNALFRAFSEYKKEFDERNNNKKNEALVKEDVEKNTPQTEEKPLSVEPYKIQLLVSQYDHPPNSPLFKGLRNIEKIKEGSLYKYYYNSSSTPSDKGESIDYVKKLGFIDAFVLKKKSLEKVPIEKGNHYRVLLFQSRRKYNLNHRVMRGLKSIRAEKIKRNWCYYYGKTADYTEAQNLLKNLRDKGFKEAIVVKS